MPRISTTLMIPQATTAAIEMIWPRRCRHSRSSLRSRILTRLPRDLIQRGSSLVAVLLGHLAAPESDDPVAAMQMNVEWAVSSTFAGKKILTVIARHALRG